jgi:hypothetical protein
LQREKVKLVIVIDEDTYTDFLPAGPRKAKTTALKNASELPVLKEYV